MSYVFGGNTGLTPESLARRRAIAESMLSNATGRAPQNIGEGLNAVGQALAGRILFDRVGRDEQQARDSANEEFAPILAALSGRSLPQTSSAQPSSASALPAALIQSESGGDFAASNSVPGSGGVGHFGRGQFSQGRLQDAMNAGVIPQGTTPDQFMADPAMQQSVEQWHAGDVQNFIDQNNLGRFVGQNINGTQVTPDGMLAVAHLGGNAGLQRFLESGGQYNPSDVNGTSLSDYLAMHGGGGQPTGQTGPQIAQAAPQAGPGLSMERLLQVSQNPFLTEGQRGIVNTLMQQRMQPVDPMRQLQIQQLQQELQTGAPGYISPVDQQRLDLDRQRFAFEREGAGRTDDTSEYEFYAQQERAAGREPVPYLDFITAQRNAGAARTSVNVGEGDSAWERESAKLFAQRYDDLTTQAQSAGQMLGLYDIAETALDSGLRTGALGGAEQTLRRFAQAMGIENSDAIAGGELLSAVTNRMALMMRNPDSGMGMPGAVSDRDLRFLTDAQIGIDRSPEGNRRMLAAFRAIEQRKIDIARLADQYIQQNGRLDTGFNQMVRDFAEANPMFGERGQPDQPIEQRQQGEDGIIDWTDL